MRSRTQSGGGSFSPAECAKKLKQKPLPCRFPQLPFTHFLVGWYFAGLKTPPPKILGIGHSGAPRVFRKKLRYNERMSPTVFKEKGFRFFFFSREEKRIHVHINCADGEAKYWLEPEIELAKNYRLSKSQLKQTELLIEDHYNELISAWHTHFGC